ncbi:hypothetical protein SASPL_155601 [Salvia splendens]|uniref:Uncharacterized protein n=1 Tax=Salvia splendens TaxID=180675 RepID=A0A8X8YXC3_SALSN|nr:hypothetical protein SASPL_155601 [Salvia splendens]
MSKAQGEILERRPFMCKIQVALQKCEVSKAPRLSREIYQTWVTLILKLEDAFEIKNFRLISMIGSLYKIIAKILAKRLSMIKLSVAVLKLDFQKIVWLRSMGFPGGNNGRKKIWVEMDSMDNGVCEEDLYVHPRE